MSVAIRGNVAVRGNVLANTTIGDFVALTGATDTTVLANLVAYLKIQNLWDSVRFFPFKSAQNKGSGTTVYGLGGWTSNDIALVNGPTWGANGVAFDAVDDRGTIGGLNIGILPSLTIFERQNPTNASLADNYRFGFLAFSANGVTLYNNIATSFISGETVCIGITVWADVRRAGTSDLIWSAGDSVQIVTIFQASGFKIYKGKIDKTLNKTTGVQDFSPQIIGSSSETLLLNSGSGTTLTATTRVAMLLCKTSLTTAQRETITDYLDAL